MNAAQKIIDATYSNVVYESVVGKIVLETAFENGQAITTLWVVFPDGCGTEVENLQQAFQALEL
jgi:hypothetical protein